MDAMIPYFNACSLSVVSDSFFGFSSGSNYYVSPADMQWYCYTKYGILLTGSGLPSIPPTAEPNAPVPLNTSSSKSSPSGVNLSVFAFAGILGAVAVLSFFVGVAVCWVFGNRSGKKDGGDSDGGVVVFADVGGRRSGGRGVGSGRSMQTSSVA
ncbi:hypothetical protein HDU98_007558 [Podochytrium sp. JEL0797]|nr:hypothetical protein HDU98_007558 [Podochytrium sp. JEL0797]